MVNHSDTSQDPSLAVQFTWFSGFSERTSTAIDLNFIRYLCKDCKERQLVTGPNEIRKAFTKIYIDPGYKSNTSTSSGSNNSSSRGGGGGEGGNYEREGIGKRFYSRFLWLRGDAMYQTTRKIFILKTTLGKITSYWFLYLFAKMYMRFGLSI